MNGTTLNDDYAALSLSHRVLQILLGSLLGDASMKIAKGYRNARCSMRHSVVQYDYLRWKFRQLSPELRGKLTPSPPDPASYSDESKVIYQSRVHTALTRLHHITHRDNEKCVSRDWLGPIDALALAIWWCDDGNLNPLTRQGVICTDGFKPAETQILSDYLASDWGTATRVKPVPKRPGQMRLHLDRKDTITLLHIVMPHIPVAGMMYKVMPCLGNFADQQRWISTVIDATTDPQLRAYLTSRYDQPLRHYDDRQDFVEFFLRLRAAARDGSKDEARRSASNDLTRE